MRLKLRLALRKRWRRQEIERARSQTNYSTTTYKYWARRGSSDPPAGPTAGGHGRGRAGHHHDPTATPTGSALRTGRAWPTVRQKTSQFANDSQRAPGMAAERSLPRQVPPRQTKTNCQPRHWLAAFSPRARRYRHQRCCPPATRSPGS
jgi:hypothetical protein